MKNTQAIIVILSFLTVGCTDRGFLNSLIGGDKEINIPKNCLFVLHENDTLKFVSLQDTEMYCISHLIEGKYYEGTTGTCGKRPFDIYNFQAIYIRAIDSTDGYYFAYPEMSDCNDIPSTSTDYVSIIKNATNIIERKYDARLSWYDDFNTLESKYDNYFETIKLNDKVYYKIYVYSSAINQTSRLEKLYYSKTIGFVGYQLKNKQLYVLK